MEPVPNNDDLKKELETLIRDLKAKSTVVPRPGGFAGSTVASYYNEEHATQMKAVLDSMVEGKDYLLLAKPLGIKVNTLRTRMYQGWQYLINHMDTPDEKYAKLKDATQLVPWPEHGHKEGMAISWGTRRVSKLAPLQGEVIDSLEYQHDWRGELDNYMSNAQDNEVFSKDNLALTEDEFLALKDAIDITDDFIWIGKNTVNKIEILKSKIFKKML